MEDTSNSGATTPVDPTLLNALWRSSDKIHQVGTLDRQSQAFKNIPVNGVADAVNRLFPLSESGIETYIACAEYEKPDSRTAANTSGAYAFWLDIDCGHAKAVNGKGYATAKEAEAAVQQFCQDTEVPLPTHITSSGGGIHVYWSLDHFVPRVAWQDYARKIKALTKACGLLADDSRTADIASVLRLPGTLNHKYTPPKPVTLIYAADSYIQYPAMLGAIDRAYEEWCNPTAAQSQKTSSSITHALGVASSGKLAEIAAMLAVLNPDMGRDDWIRIGMAIFHETAGNDEGFDIWDHWSSNGSKYPDEQGLRAQWRSFRLDVANPITIATIRKLVADAGHDWMEVCASAGEQFEIIDTEVVESEPTSPKVPESNPVLSPVKEPVNPLQRFSLTGKSAEIEKMAVEQVPILGRIALKGQSTIIYAAPNTGKTLLTLHLIIEGIKVGRIDASNLFYLNMDDTGKGLLDKLHLAEEYGFHMLSEGHHNFMISDFLSILTDMIDANQCHGTIIVLDTLKKFANLMDKQKASSFTKVIRRFVVKGGTLIALAHTNKHRGPDGKPVYSGTTDIVDDSDCAYTLASVTIDDSGLKVVEFENIKRRGNVVQTAGYSYTIGQYASYGELLTTVCEVDPNSLEPMKQAEQLKSDTEVIQAVVACIQDGVNTKMKLAEAAAAKAGISKRSALQLIEKYTGNDPATHRWTYTVGERGAKFYTLLPVQLPNSEAH